MSASRRAAQRTGLETERVTSMWFFADLGDPRPFRNLHVVAPKLTPPVAEDLNCLAWESGRDDRLVDVEWILDEFLQLADVGFDDPSLRHFAASYGPLVWRPSRGRSGQETTVISESKIHWQALARALQALLEVGAAVGADSAPGNPADWYRALEAPDIALVLVNGEEEDRYLVSEDGRFVHDALAPNAVTADPKMRLRMVTNALIDAAGVRVDIGIGAVRSAGPFVAIPARDRGGQPHEDSPDGLVLNGLLCLFATQAGLAIRDNRVKKCDWCGRQVPLAKLSRKPRNDIPFYDSHEHCRREAILQSKRESQKRRYRRLRDAARPSQRAPEGP